MTTPSEAAKKWARRKAKEWGDMYPIDTRDAMAEGFDAGVAHARAEWEGEKEKVREIVGAINDHPRLDTGTLADQRLQRALSSAPSWAKE